MWPEIFRICTGDWNLGLEPSVDYHDHVNSDIKSESVSENLIIMGPLRQTHMSPSSYSDKTHQIFKNKMKKKLRLNDSLICKQSMSFVNWTNISGKDSNFKKNLTFHTGHRIINLELNFNTLKNGPG